MPQVPIWGCVLIVLAVAALCGALAFFAGVNHRKREAEAAIGSAEDEAKRIISNAIKTAAAKKKEAVLEGKDEIHRLRNESEREMNDRRKEIQRQERRVSQKEESLDKKMENLESKEVRSTCWRGSLPLPWTRQKSICSSYLRMILCMKRPLK